MIRRTGAQALAFPDASRIWEAECIEHRRIEDASEIDLDPPDLLLSGTSEEAEEDAHLWRWAKHSVAFVDNWVNYRLRFSAGLPSKICVIDDSMARGVVSEVGIPPERVVVTGSPAFDREVDQELVTELRTGWLSGHRRLALFASEPGSQWALDLVARSLDDSFFLMVRPHPRECSILTPAYESCLAADVVLGVSTLLLHEASLLGVPVVWVKNGPELKQSLRRLPPFGPRHRRVLPNATDKLLEALT